MLVYPRRQALLDQLAQAAMLTVGNAARLLVVSEVTIRSDLKVLAQQGLIRRIRGGPAPATTDLAHAGRRHRAPRGTMACVWHSALPPWWRMARQRDP